MLKIVLKSLTISIGLIAIFFILPASAKAVLTVGATSIATDSTLNLQGGNIGIGDSTPDQLLEVLSATAADAQISVTNTSTGDALLGFQVVDGTNLFTMGIDNSDADKFKISIGPFSDDFHILVIDENGNVGIANNAPEQPLHVIGDTYIDSGAGITTNVRLMFRHYRTGIEHKWEMGPATGGGTTAFSFNNVTDGITDILAFSTAGNVGVGTATPTEKLDINSDNIRIRTAKTPANATEACNQGEISWDASYTYVCVADNTWKRSAIATW